MSSPWRNIFPTLCFNITFLAGFVILRYSKLSATDPVIVLTSEIDDPASVSMMCTDCVIVNVFCTGIIVVAFKNNCCSLIYISIS